MVNTQKILEETFDPVMDQASYDRLDMYFPHHIAMLEVAIGQGVAPEEAIRYLRRNYPGPGWDNLWTYVKPAARHIQRGLE